jgi:2-C-methyl-D-erythritol 2,4-cyclodiphosphate synthase
MKQPFRIGEGWDIHALVPGRALILGGVRIDHPKGLLGHSDADALAHAVTDALLGAAGLGDIGRMFPDTDAQHAGADSMVLLGLAAQRVGKLATSTPRSWPRNRACPLTCPRWGGVWPRPWGSRPNRSM